MIADKKREKKENRRTKDVSVQAMLEFAKWYEQI